MMLVLMSGHMRILKRKIGAAHLILLKILCAQWKMTASIMWDWIHGTRKSSIRSAHLIL